MVAYSVQRGLGRYQQCLACHWVNHVRRCESLLSPPQCVGLSLRWLHVAFVAFVAVYVAPVRRAGAGMPGAGEGVGSNRSVSAPPPVSERGTRGRRRSNGGSVDVLLQKIYVSLCERERRYHT